MKEIQHHLKGGHIRIAARSQQLLRASYIPHGKSPISVESDRGITHLLLILKAAIIHSKDLKEKADRRYLYPVSTLHPEKIITSGTCVILSWNRGEYIAHICSIQAEIIPGVYRSSGKGETIQEAYLMARIAKDSVLMS